MPLKIFAVWMIRKIVNISDISKDFWNFHVFERVSCSCENFRGIEPLKFDDFLFYEMSKIVEGFGFLKRFYKKFYTKISNYFCKIWKKKYNILWYNFFTF